MDSQEQSLFPRIFVCGLLLIALVTAAAIFAINMQAGDRLPVGTFDLSGDWEFSNGLAPSGEPNFAENVRVPEPLISQLHAPLAAEFWYRKSFRLPAALTRKSLAIFLGTIKGEHEVYLNGERIGAGGKLVLAVYQVPPTFIVKGENKITVHVKRMDHLFPGIVHKLPLAIGPQETFVSSQEFYFFNSGVKPLMLATFKFCLFLLFAVSFLSLPKRKEYLSFALFTLFSAVSAALYSRYIPFYFDFYLRNGLTFLFSTFAFSMIPWVTADILRLKTSNRLIARVFGVSLGLIFLSATLWIKDRGIEITLYELAGRWVPFAVGVPSVIASMWTLYLLPSMLIHRRIQISTYAFFLSLGTLGWWLNSGANFSFTYIPYPELWDMGLFAGLAASAAMDMRFTSRRSERTDRVVPKWFSGFLASGAEQVTLELPMVAIAVDTVGYTRLLSELDTEGKSRLHSNIRARMAPLVERFGAQKLSDRGDGALFAWDLSGDEQSKRAQMRVAIAAAEFLVTESASSVGIKFRVGLAAGIVRGELKGSELSFLGEPLNAASRLEAIAKPGSVLLHESAVSYVDPASLSSDWIQVEVKGVSYKAVTLSKTG